MAVKPTGRHDDRRRPLPLRAATMSSQIVGEVRADLFDGALQPGDFLGTEKTLAERFGVSRTVAREALCTLEALGVVAIKVGAGGGARIAHGNIQLFAEALAVQLNLTGVAVAEIMTAQRGIECLAAELAASQSTPADVELLRRLVDQAESALDDVNVFTRLAHEFHLAIAEASHNRVLVVQLVSLQHVAWPERNVTLTTDMAQHLQGVHRELVSLIELRDPAAARQLMAEHVQMIGARRIAEQHTDPASARMCC